SVRQETRPWFGRFCVPRFAVPRIAPTSAKTRSCVETPSSKRRGSPSSQHPVFSALDILVPPVASARNLILRRVEAHGCAAQRKVTHVSEGLWATQLQTRRARASAGGWAKLGLSRSC